MRPPAVLFAVACTFALVSGCVESSEKVVATAISPEALPLPPDEKRGKKVAEQQCSRCHAIDLNDVSANADAPPLRDLYKRYALEDLRRAFVRGIEVAHPQMPVIQLPDQAVDDLLVYLRSIDPCVQLSSDEVAMARCFEPL